MAHSFYRTSLQRNPHSRSWAAWSKIILPRFTTSNYFTCILYHKQCTCRLRISASGTTFSELVESLCLFLNCRSADKVYHVSIMPCFDKKLEASREQFYSDVFHTRDVDCVISTLEVEQMLLKDGVDLVCLPSADLDSM